MSHNMTIWFISELFSDEHYIYCTDKGATKPLLQWLMHQNASNTHELPVNNAYVDDLSVQLHRISTYLYEENCSERAKYYEDLSQQLRTDTINVHLMTLWAAIVDDWDEVQYEPHTYEALCDMLDLKDDWNFTNSEKKEVGKLYEAAVLGR